MKQVNRDSAASSTPNPVSRRRALRLQAPNGVTITLSDPRIAATPVDIGTGGVGLITNLPLGRGVVYGLTLRLGKKAVTCQARAAHSRRVGDGRWLVGMAFVTDEQVTASVDGFLDAITASQLEFS